MRAGAERLPPPPVVVDADDTRAPPSVEPLPRWFWLLPLLVAALWWPIDPYWASDDFFALHYARDPAQALRDFGGPQYGAADLFLFYRPLITLSLCWDVQLFGAEPFPAHLENVLVHAISALLVACLWRRLLPDRLAFAAGLLWAALPGMIGGIAWTVGRVDGFCVVFVLLAVLLTLQSLEGRPQRRWLGVLAMALGLLAKELAMCTPGLVAIAAFALGPGTGLAGRFRAAARATGPFAALLAVYLVLRRVLLGSFGGYVTAHYDPLAMVRGLGAFLLDEVAPLRWCRLRDVWPTFAEHAALPWLALLPAVATLVWCVRRRERRAAALGGIAWFLCASVTAAGFFAGADNHQSLRYFTLAAAGLTGLMVAGGLWPLLLAFAAILPATVQVRIDQWRADVASARMHRQLLQQHAQFGLPGPWFVAGLPHTDPTGIAMQFHFGVDRLLLPPFATDGPTVYAHRPLAELPGVVHLVDDDAVPIALPSGTTCMFSGADVLTTVLPHLLPELPLAGSEVVDCTTPQLRRFANGEAILRLTTPGVRSPALRLTFFTAAGYFGAVVENHAPPGQDGFVDVARFLREARWATGSRLIDVLDVPTVVDLSTDFPVLIEGGELRGGRFAPTHRAARLVPFRFDRGYAALLRGL